MKLFFVLLLCSLSLFGFSQNILFQSDFSSGIPSNMTMQNLDQNIPYSSLVEFASNEAWISIADPDSLTNSVASSCSYFMEADSADRWLITPQLTMGSFGNYFYWKAKSHDPSFPDDYLVLISTTDNSPESFTDTIGNVEEENFEWTNREVNLSHYGYNDSTIYIAFVLKTFDGFKLYLDDVLIESENDLSVQNISYPKVILYPNPATSQLNIRGVASEKIKSIKIYNVFGEIVLESFESTLDISQLRNGQYIVRLMVEDQLINSFFIKN